MKGLAVCLVLWTLWALEKEKRKEIEQAWGVFLMETTKARNRMYIKSQLARGGERYGLQVREDIGA